MRNEDSLSNVSISKSDTYGIRFNGSSKSSTPQNDPEAKLQKFIEFQEFRNTRAPLKIRIDNNQDEAFEEQRQQRRDKINRQIQQDPDQYEGPQLHSPIQRDFEEDRPIRLVIQYRQKIDQLSQKVRKLEEKVYYYEDYNRRLLSDYQQAKSNEEEHMRVIREMDIIIQTKEQNCLLHRQLIDNLNKKIQYFEREQGFFRQLDDAILQKDSKIKELTKHIDKLYSINRDLESDLRQSSMKIVELQKQIQKLSYSELKQNIIKLKQNMPNNKSGIQIEGAKRRSLKKSEKPMTLKTQPNQRINDHQMERYHYSRNF